MFEARPEDRDENKEPENDPHLLVLFDRVPPSRPHVDEVACHQDQHAVSQILCDLGQRERNRPIRHQEGEPGNSSDDAEEGHEEFLLTSLDHLRCISRFKQTRIPEISRAHPILNQPEHHTDSGGSEAPVPVVALTEESSHERSEEGAEVDAHIEDGEAGVTPRPSLRIQLTDHRADVRLE